MSDIYVELRSRIAVVAAKTRLGTARIQEAQDAVGLSNEAVARRIPVSERTWRRWKESGEIPTASLPAAAAALRLELRELAAADDYGASDGLSTTVLAEEVADIRAIVLALAEHAGVDIGRALGTRRSDVEPPRRSDEAP